MKNAEREKICVCQICGSKDQATLHPGVLVRPAVADLIQTQAGTWSEEGWICGNDLKKFRNDYVRSFLQSEKGELTQIEEQVIESLRQQEILSQNPVTEMETASTNGQRLADRIAAVGGSWTFILWFCSTSKSGTTVKSGKEIKITEKICALVDLGFD